MKTARKIKNTLYGQVAHLGKAVSSPKRLELIEVLCQGEKNVEQLAVATDISVKLTSAHLKVLKSAHLVDARRAGKNAYYRLLDARVADMWVMLREFAAQRLPDLQHAMGTLAAHPSEISPVYGKELLARARNGRVVVIDVRPEPEYLTAHLPYARSLPLAELKRRRYRLPLNTPVVAYCRGPFCLMAKEAVGLLVKNGYRAMRLEDGVAEWRTRGLPLIAYTN